MPKTSIPECCIDCIKWEKFREDCHVYWEGKKNCTQHSRLWGSEQPIL
ncbi:MAG: hypothetical protein Q7J54_07535 [Candidatus Woesearchaeota archaeon]|nr:hypothetical protein [Candidatus Woesearchaeota archaeon]